MKQKLTNQEKPKRRSAGANSPNENEIKDDVIGGSPAGGIAGTGGVSTNDVGASITSKNPLNERV